MTRCGPHLLVLVITLSSALDGCTAYRAYRACGSGGCPEDVQISAEVRAALDQHPELRSPNRLYVQTLGGVVYLSGQVATELQRDIAGSVAHQAVAPHRVVNDVGLEYTGR